MGAALVGSYFIGTFLHGDDLSFHSWYEMAEALLVTLVVCAGVLAMKSFLARNAEILGQQNAELGARVRELAAVSSLARTVGATSDHEFMWSQGLLMAREATACDAGILFLQSEEGVLEPHHWIGLSDEVATMADAIRATDVLARYGGEEFVVLLPETDLPEAIQTGERIREAVEDRFAVEDGAANSKMDSGAVTVRTVS